MSRARGRLGHAVAYAERYPEQVRGVLAVAANGPANSEDGVESLEDFFQRDASPERLAAHRHNLATRRMADSIGSMLDFVDAYVSRDAMGW